MGQLFCCHFFDQKGLEIILHCQEQFYSRFSVFFNSSSVAVSFFCCIHLHGTLLITLLLLFQVSSFSSSDICSHFR